MSDPSLPQNPKTDRILVVDDSPDNVLLVKTILEEEGYDITQAESGYSALAQIDQSPPDLVLLDIMMPGMDGYEVTRRIRGNKKLSFIPILLITAHDQPSVVEGLDLGADDFIRKPVELDELLARVRSLLRLKHSVDERNEIARQREDFVSRLTHDLRTPLVAADRMLTLLKQEALGPITPQMEEVFTTMVRSNQNLLKMVNTLLEVYRYEADRKNLNFSLVDMPQLIQEIIEELMPIAQEKDTQIKMKYGTAVNGSGKTSGFVRGDRLELRRLVTNLVGNAIKFTDNGMIEIRITEDETGKNAGGPNWVGIAVADNGPGISEADQTLLFERFLPGKHKRSGSGLGLHLCKRITEAHNGTIDVKSVLGQGSVFSVRLPAWKN
ncbi:hybrid sensor histidine kinase/response regulator [Laspinema olomoucense]|uniref:histidine kinase n=1 Tax=Laspinema olomoucense D3b TaxID=2953688 RepID=A0ABT2NEN3_9CYAN|nr:MULTISPECIES: hybrid sensor histidine kinase/response regulator [unclassified Laspinema]MCT7971547.1 hybrid sensor histidine kinase/response regulator [Laspinema sp. D3d]MCT7980941.1 hybrid sensor histidine kinase/response regulator [Laspinema sp. D3b]MCT7990929.1 hybrid sensor histidine kinase/response regulator [Laspinema sp. D3a]MCT7995412.1 hybrid sensor histidine kinase/response regulator [Laspinema sp. D3c]